MLLGCRNAKVIMLSYSQLLAEMIMASTCSLGEGFNGRLECTFKATTKKILATAILLDVEQEVL